MHTYTQIENLTNDASTPQTILRRTYVSIYICIHIHTYMHIHICAPPASSVSQMCSWCQTNTCIMYTSAHALVPRTPVPKCMQHPLEKICIHMHTISHAHPWRCPTRQRLAAETHNLCTNIHTHTFTHVYTCIHILIRIHMHICTHVHVFTHAYMYIYTHTHTTCTYRRTQARLEQYLSINCVRSLTLHQEVPSFSWKGVAFHDQPSWPVLEERQISEEQPRSTVLHHTITAVRCPDHTCSSVLVQNQFTRSMAALTAGHGDHASTWDSYLGPFSRRFSIFSWNSCQIYVCSSRRAKKKNDLFQLNGRSSIMPKLSEMSTRSHTGAKKRFKRQHNQLDDCFPQN